MKILIISPSLYGVGICAVLERQSPWQVKHESAQSPEAVAALAESYQPHVTILDGALNALALSQQLDAKLLGRIMVMVAGALDGEALFWLAQWGVSVCIQPSITPEDLATLVLQVSNDERLVSSSILELPREASFPQRKTVVPFFPQTIAELAPDSPLSEQEEHILYCAARGMGNKEIASKLKLSKMTIAHDLKQIFARFGVDNRTSAVVHALHRWWVRMPEDPAPACTTAVA